MLAGLATFLGPFRKPTSRSRQPQPTVTSTAAPLAPTVLQRQTESYLEQQSGEVASRSGLTFHDASCAAPRAVTVGTKYECTAVGPDGLTYSFFAEVSAGGRFVVHSGHVPTSTTVLSG